MIGNPVAFDLARAALRSRSLAFSSVLSELASPLALAIPVGEEMRLTDLVQFGDALLKP